MRLLVALAWVAGCAAAPAPAPPPVARHAPVMTFALLPYDADAPTHARVTRMADGAVVETIDVETSTWTSPARALVQAAAGEQWLSVCEDYDAAQARCPHPIWIRVYPGAHVHRTTPP